MLIETFVAIIDRLIGLVEGRIKGRKEVFDRVLEPIFSDLLMVHGDYLKILTGAQQIVRDGVTSLDHDLRSAERRGEITKEEFRVKFDAGLVELARKGGVYLEQARLSFEPVRVKIRAFQHVLGAQLKSSLHKEEVEFVSAVGAYLPTGEFGSAQGLIGKVTAATNLIHQLRMVERNPKMIDRFWETFRREMTDHQARWSALCVAFATLRLAIASTR